MLLFSPHFSKSCKSFDYLPNGQLFNFMRKLQVRCAHNMFTSAIGTLSKPNEAKRGDGPSNGPSYFLSVWLKYLTISLSWNRITHRPKPIIPSLDQPMLILNIWVYRSIALDTHLSSWSNPWDHPILHNPMLRFHYLKLTNLGRKCCFVNSWGQLKVQFLRNHLMFTTAPRATLSAKPYLTLLHL